MRRQAPCGIGRDHTQAKACATSGGTGWHRLQRVRTLLRCLLTIVFAVASLAAEERAQVSGAVRDQSDAVLPESAITAVNEDTGIRRSTRADAKGEYAIAALPAGTYKVTVRRPGFQTIAWLNVRMNPGQNARLDFTMQVGSMREVVTIEEAPPLMNSTDATVATLAGQQLVDGLPLNGRGLIGIVNLSPGVITTPATLGEAGQFSANGQRPNANYFTVDGVSANTGVSGSATPAQFSGGTLPSMTAFGTSQTLSPTEDIQEVRVQTSSFAPEFGRAPGANVGITTRGGTNEMHGSVFYSGRNAVLNANDWFANAAGLERAVSSLNNWGAAIGGPLHRDRTFFFVNYEGLRLNEPFTWRTAVPSIASRRAAPSFLQPPLNAFPIPNGADLGGGLSEFVANAARPARLDLGNIRVDHALTSRISVFGRYQKAPSSAESGFSQVDHSNFEHDSLTLGTSVLVSPNVTSDFRFNVTRTAVASSWVATGAGGAVPVDLSKFFLQHPAQGAILYGFAIGGVGQILSGEGSRSRQNQWNAIETLAWNKGAHAIRGGIDYNRLAPSRDQLAQTVAGAYASLADLLAIRPMLTSSSQADQASSLIETLALFAQDTWRVTPQLTATYGVRWELTPAPAFRSATTQVPPIPAGSIVGTGGAIWPTRYTQFAPRAGLAYRLTPATVVRAGWGIFYDVEFGVATDPINAFPYNRWQFVGGGAGAAGFAGAGSSGYGYAPNLKLPYSREWNVSVEHAFRGVDVVSASYVGSAGRRLLRREATLQPDSMVALTPVATNNGRSDFDALELQYRRKLAAGLQGMASYTWSHSIDNGSWDAGIYLPAASPGPGDRGASAFDVRQSFSAGLNWRAPRHWTVSTLISARSGFPIDVLSSENFLGLSFDDFKRPDLLPGVPLRIHGRLNPGAFMIPAGSRQGNLGRNAIAGFGLGQVDLALGREFAVREESVVELRLEAFNVTNHPRFGDPVRYLNSPLFGQSASMLNLMLGSGTPHSGIAPAFQVGAPRILQVTARFRW
jgi:outer membrane receptor protein involved in Fe transport